MLIPLPPTGLSFRVNIPEQADAKVLVSGVIAALYVLVVLVYTFTDVPASETVLLATGGLLVSLLVGGATAELVKSRVESTSDSQHDAYGPPRHPPPHGRGSPYNGRRREHGRYPYDYPPTPRERRERPSRDSERRPPAHRRDREHEDMRDHEHRGDGDGRPDSPPDANESNSQQNEPQPEDSARSYRDGEDQ